MYITAIDPYLNIVRQSESRLSKSVPSILVYIIIIGQPESLCVTSAKRDTQSHNRICLARIIYNSTRGMPYLSTLFYANLNSMSSSIENFSRVFFCNIMDPTSCLHSFLPPPRFTVITPRLRFA